MEKSRQIWEQVPIAHSNIPERYRGFYRNLLCRGYVDVGFGDTTNPTVSINHNVNCEIIGATKGLCETMQDQFTHVSAGIPTDDKQRFVVEMAYRLQIIALNEDSDFGKALADFRDMATKGPGAILRKTAMGYIALYYFENMQKPD